jgi:hypothetical protein
MKIKTAQRGTEGVYVRLHHNFAAESHLRPLAEITLPVAAATTGTLAAFVLGKILAIALLLLRFFLWARSRLRSALAPELGKVISASRLSRNWCQAI